MFQPVSHRVAKKEGDRESAKIPSGFSRWSFNFDLTISRAPWIP